MKQDRRMRSHLMVTLAALLVAGAAIAQPSRLGTGEMCNAGRNPPRLCAQGLDCRTLPGRPSGGDGVCGRPAAPEGEVCNYTVYPPLECTAGLECRVPPTPPGQVPMAGQGGTCRRPG
jgi:hypothetical protein